MPNSTWICGTEETPEAEEAETVPPQDAASPAVVNYRQQLLDILSVFSGV